MKILKLIAENAYVLMTMLPTAIRMLCQALYRSLSGGKS